MRNKLGNSWGTFLGTCEEEKEKPTFTKLWISQLKKRGKKIWVHFYSYSLTSLDPWKIFSYLQSCKFFLGEHKLNKTLKKTSYVRTHTQSTQKNQIKYFLSISSSLFLPQAQASKHKPPIQLPIWLQTVKEHQFIHSGHWLHEEMQQMVISTITMI
jgi:hypothetical protein